MSRSARASHRAAAAAHRVLEGHQRRRPLGQCATRTSGSRASASCSRAVADSRSTARNRSRSRPATSCCCRRRPASRCRASSRRRRCASIPKWPPAATGDVRHGTRHGPPDVRLLGGYFVFDSPDAALLVSLLPALMHVRGVERLSVLVQLVDAESSEQRSGRDLVLSRLVEVLLIEALRSTSGDDAPPGLLRGLADARIARAMRHMHDDPARAWTVAQLATKAALSRSAFYERFTRTVGLPPMEYLLAWRMAAREGPAAPPGARDRRGRRTRGLWLGEHLQHGVQPARRPAAGALRRRAEGSHSLTASQAVVGVDRCVCVGRCFASAMRRSAFGQELEVSLQGSWRFGRPGLCGQTCCGRSRLGRLLRAMKGR